MNIKISNASYEKAVRYFKEKGTCHGLWVDISKTNPEAFTKDASEQYEIFEYMGVAHRKVYLFICKQDINRWHTVTLVPCDDNNKLSVEEHDRIIDTLTALFYAEHIEWEEMQ